uniref:Uncharacterized protein n=1 Tax=Corethron hystrix TaxID=216773 RepID=A0A6U5E7Y9_9STRA|mmetsp:Transcript_15991/g.35986  ORF Transcript_15991/g.35986 Transcript_15991/m.35986 type:complete len:348 (+) Transcript_15991:155-1198(+)
MKRAMQKRTRQKLKEELPPGILSPGAKRDKKETRSSFRSKTSHFLLPHAPPLRAPIPILPLLLAFLYPILILSTEVPLEYRSIITPIRAIGSYISDDELSNCKNNLIHADTDGNDGLSFLEYPTFLFKQSDGKLSYNNDDNVMPLSFVATFNIVACASCSAEESCCADRELNLVIPSENGDDPETNFLLNICTYMNKKISQVLQADLQTKVPSPQPSYRPSIMPTVYPSPTPSAKPTSFPTPSPTKSPTAPPTTYPSRRPTSKPTQNPTTLPTTHPSRRETSKPTLLQSPQSYSKPTPQPTVSPTLYPTCIHLLYPSFEPSEAPTPRLTLQPTSKPLFTKEQPSSSE